MTPGEIAKGLYDKNRRPIEIGDILKVFHFVGARRKRHFMYKQVARETTLGANKTPYLAVSHLDMQEGAGHEYYLQIDGSVLLDYEIVQSIDARFEDRPRLAVRAILEQESRGE